MAISKFLSEKFGGKGLGDSWGASCPPITFILKKALEPLISNQMSPLRCLYDHPFQMKSRMPPLTILNAQSPVKLRRSYLQIYSSLRLWFLLLLGLGYASSSLKFLKINLQHSLVASSQLQKSLVELNPDIVLLQEPCIGKFGKTSGVTDQFRVFSKFDDEKNEKKVT